MVTKCVCFGKTFAELKAVMQQRNLRTFEQLKSEVAFGENCQLCVAYIHKMIETGQTAFQVKAIE
ncbi:MAG: (2Fe-2S)-binding protein [[Chlorobium] sp. 445]|nr:MAG: (2Fe-2S)-binding protein [[Chlorobium] sp. 445]